MIRIENVEVFGWSAAIRGMRSPMNSWDKSDTVFDGDKWCVGENDLALMHKLALSGDDHGKFARFINVTVDITAPLYWWKEASTYKVGTVSNSCSTMHKIMDKPFEVSDFSFDYVLKNIDSDAIAEFIQALNEIRDVYLSFDELLADGKIRDGFSKKGVWYTLIQLLPSAYNQRRTMLFNYQVLNRIYHARKNHKLDEWHVFCDWIEGLPWFKEIYLGGEDD